MLNAILLTAAMAIPDSTVLEERIDLYDPTTGAFIGAERTWFGADGRRLRLEITDGDGTPTLIFFVLHDDRGRESEAIYFESGPDPIRERFTYSDDGRVQTTTYYYEPDVPSDRMETYRDSTGRERSKRFFRANGEQYGEEDVLWDSDGRSLGWDFRYVERDGGASFRYRYEAFDDDGNWTRRVRSRDGVPERVEVRTTVTRTGLQVFRIPARFALGKISTDELETSPSFTRDGMTMVFARYGEDWESKRPFLATLGDDGWHVEPILGIGPIYNLAISPDGNTIIFARRSDEFVSLFRTRMIGDSWSDSEDLTARYGLTGSYPTIAANGDLFYFDAHGASGPGIYTAPGSGEGFGAPQPVFAGAPGNAFDPYVDLDRQLLWVTQCFDTTCQSGERNGIWELNLRDVYGSARKLSGVPYGWGAQPVSSLGLFVFTDGEDILAVPLNGLGHESSR